MHAIVRTVILAAAAGGLANDRAEIAQELRTGTAAILFIALAIYRGAMLAIARLRRAPATT